MTISREQYENHLAYSADLQRIIEGLCRGGPIPEPKTTARHHYDMAVAYLSSTKSAPISPGWPDPLESPQAEAIRNGKIDDTEIRNLFDTMERELRLHREMEAATKSEKVDVDRVLDVAGDYMGKQYGNTALHHPIDRARILAALASEPANG